MFLFSSKLNVYVGFRLHVFIGFMEHYWLQFIVIFIIIRYIAISLIPVYKEVILPVQARS